MNVVKYPINIHKAYHAHIYFIKKDLAFVSNLCEQIKQLFHLSIGTIHQKLVGPHTQWNCRILFSYKSFDTFIPWLDQHRENLNILIHAITGDDIKDHTAYAYWLGDSIPIDLTKL